MDTYEIIKRKDSEGYWIRKKDKSCIIHHPNNPKLIRYEKYTSKKAMTEKNALKQLYFLNHILPNKKSRM